MNQSDSKKYPIRNTVRIVLLNGQNQLLLMRVDDPGTHSVNEKYAGSFWVTIGGKQEGNETAIQTAQRELTEETGLRINDVSFGPVIWLRELDLVLYTKAVHLNEQYILAHTNINEVSPTNLSKYESNIVKELRWFTAEDIARSKDTIYPLGLNKLISDVLAKKIPREPIKIK